MTHATIDLTDHNTHDAERRGATLRGTRSPVRLMLHKIEQTRRQLADARQRLEAARTRVAQLEDAAKGWEDLASELYVQGPHSCR